MATTNWVFGNTELSLGPGVIAVAPTNTAEDDWESATYTDLGGFSSLTVRDNITWTDLTEAQKGTSWADKVLTGDNTEIECALTRPYVERMEDLVPGLFVDYATDGVTVQQVSRHRRIGRRLSAGKIWIRFKANDETGVVSTNPLEWIYMLASPSMDTIEQVFDAATQRTYPVMFGAFECADITNAAGQPALWWTGVAL